MPDDNQQLLESLGLLYIGSRFALHELNYDWLDAGWLGIE